MKSLLVYIVILLFATGVYSCTDFPKDAAGTLKKISGQTVRVGITSSATGVDSALVRGFAQHINAKIVWVHGDQLRLTEQLSKHQIDMAIGGFTKDAPLDKLVAFTKPYLKAGKKEYVIAVPKGENALMMSLEQHISANETK